MEIVESAARLFNLLGATDTTFTKHLKPGLSVERIEELVRPTNILLPPELMAFHSHFSFEKGYDQAPPDYPTFYGIYALLSLEDAIESYQFRRTFDFLDPVEHEWLPFLQEDGNGYLVNTVADANGHYPIISIFHALASEIKYMSLTAMFDTFYQWINEGVLQIDNGHVPGDYEGDPKRIAKIAAQLNPGVVYWEERLGKS